MNRYMKERKVLTIIILVCFALITNFTCQSTTVEAKATKKAMKFLKGTWATTHHPCEKVVFTKKYMKVYAGYDKNRNEYKGKKTANSIIFYKGFRNGLTCQWKENGEWMYSFSDSLSRI